jgi:ribosomal-protein-alanine N-acetyltransferase
MAVIETSRLQMRRLDAGDADFLVALMNDPAYIEHIGDRGLRTPAQAEAYIRDVVLPSYRRHGYGMYLLTLKEGGPRIGIAGLVNRPNLTDVDVGFAVARAHWGHGYASEAAAAVLVHAARDFGLQRVVGVVAPGNAASIRVLEKIGLSYEGQVCLTPGEPPILLYGRDLRDPTAGISPKAS